MGTWEDDSTTLLDPLNVTNKCISSYVTYNEENDADVEVAVDNVKVDVNGGECCDRESNPVAEGGGLVQQFERLEYEDNVNKDVSLIAIHHNETDVDAVNNNGEECCDHERNLVIEEAGVFQQFESLEFQNNVNKYVLSDGSQHKEYDVEVEAVNVNGDGCHDDESHGVMKEVDLVQQFEKLEYQNNLNKDVSSVWSYHNENDVDVEFESGNVKRDGYCHGVIEEGDLVQQFVRQEFLNYGTEGSKHMERHGEIEHLKYYDDEKKTHLYPMRPYAVDCSFYIKTGTCKYGQSCKYNHPQMRGYQPVGDKEKQFEEISGSVLDAGKIQCKYCQTPGGCKYRDTCRYNHSAPKTERECLQLNFLGLPIRQSAQECTYYLRNGSCAYGASCKYNHPDPCAIEVSEPANGNSLENGKFVRGGTSSANNDGERMQYYGGESWGTSQLSNRKNVGNGLRYPSEMMSYHQAMPPAPGCNQNQVVSNNSKRVDPSVHYENLLQMEEFPERPGQPDCDYFMKTGNCKYRSACRYNHPTSQASKLRLPPLSSKLPYPYSRAAPMLCAESSLHHDQNSNNMRSNGSSFAVHQNHRMQNKEFPERPDQPECEYFMKTGQCKFMSSCRYHHPRSQALSSSQCTLNEKGLPLRPGAKLCRNYEQLGMCKYNVNCLYDHPDGLVI